jgi:hypothetical protein
MEDEGTSETFVHVNKFSLLKTFLVNNNLFMYKYCTKDLLCQVGKRVWFRIALRDKLLDWFIVILQVRCGVRVSSGC